MTTTKIPDFTASKDGSVGINQAGRTLHAEANEISRKQRALDAAFTGAVAASLFYDHPWLDALTIKLSATAEYDDSGGTYRSINVQVSDLLVVPGVAVQEDFMTEGALDEDLAADRINESIEDGAHEMFSAFYPGHHEYDEIEIKLKRSVIAALLQSDECSGAAAFELNFPEHAALVQPVVITG